MTCIFVGLVMMTCILQASRVLKDSSLGQPIELVMKKLVILQEADPNLKIVPNMAHTAKRFIRWKNKYENKMVESYDLALLLTRYVHVPYKLQLCL